ncbi:hypothetical protein NDQ53_20745 [Rossellomorea marisflavi]|uniref:hypothetical protein n=1 Tax=Rossellomorea marisflavi TaxID=189381 RepID=UPI002040879D|nr:hypothetical protein [Rossellomorea marisflavi]MCM2591719.1 hypothetical protein [Rossellomorea marisflavi]
MYVKKSIPTEGNRIKFKMYDPSTLNSVITVAMEAAAMEWIVNRHTEKKIRFRLFIASNRKSFNAATVRI